MSEPKELVASAIARAQADLTEALSELQKIPAFDPGSVAFVAHALTDEADATIVRSIVDMAHTLGFTVVAEGVEAEPQADFLRELGCEQAQGFLFARPMPAAAFNAHIASTAAAQKKPRRTAKQKS